MPFRLRTLTALLFAAGVYYLLARLGLMLALAQSNASPIWPPSGFALVLLLVMGRRMWPAILFGAFLANLAVFQNNQVASLPIVLAASLCIAIGNTAEAVIADFLLRRLGVQRLALQTQREVYRFGVSIAVAALASAAAGVLALRLSGIIPPELTWQVSATWWMGDFLGMLLLAPMGMALPRKPAWPRFKPGQVVFLLALVACALVIFLSDSLTTNIQLVPYVLLLFLGYAAVRRWRSMIRVSLAIIAGVAIPATVLNHGPFVSGVLHYSLLSLCTFLAIATFLAWILATDDEQGVAGEYSWTPILTLLACMAITISAWGWISRDTETRTQERFQRAADHVAETIRIQLASYESLLRAGAALFDASRDVDAAEWNRFISGMELSTEYPGVLGVGFARFVPGGALSALEPGIRLWPEGRREFYTPIVYLEPRNPRNLHAIGFDMMSEPTRRAAMLAAMQSGNLTASGPITLVQEISGPKQVGFLMFNPVYRQNDAGNAALRGFVYSPFRMGDLMQGIFGDRLRDVRLDIHFQNSQGQLMYSSHRPEIGASFTRLQDVKRIALGANGQSWALHIRPTAYFDTGIDQGKSFLVLLMGTLISLLFFGVSRNLVQERVAAEREKLRSAAHLEESEARFKLLTSHIRNHAIVLLDADGIVTTWNEGAEKIFGYRGGDIVGHPVQELQGEGDAGPALAHALQYGQHEATDLRRRQDGSTFLALTQLFPVRDEHGRCIGFAMILRDVTAEKAAEQELKDARSQAESASAAKSAFVANISHELRTPMNAVLGVSQILSRTPLNAEQRQYLDMVSGAGRTLLALLNDVLDFSKIEANKLELSEDDFLIDDVLSSLAAVMAMTAAEKGLALSLRVDADVPVALHGDAQRMQQVLLNLVSNALKFTDAGMVSVCAQREPGRPGWLRWRVSDTGIGITPEQMQRLFSPFSQADASMARRYGGTGLGLAISQRLAHMMGGQIEVASVPDQGTTFSFLLPLRASALPDPYAMPAERAGWRVLYADPATALHQDLVQLASHWGWQCDTVTSAEAMRQALGAHHYDLLVYDSTLAVAGREAVQVAHRICLRSGLSEHTTGVTAGQDPELLRPVTRSALFNALAIGHETAAIAPPLAPAPAAPEDNAGSAFREGRKVLDGLSILLAEDNQLNQLVARSMLEAVGATVHIAENGEQALAFLQQGKAPVDLVLMDVQMPVMDGFTATQRIRQAGLALPVLAMSAGVTLAERAECQAAGMNDFVAKPVDGDDLITTILRYVHP